MKKVIFVLSFFLILYTPYIVYGENINNIIEETENIKTPNGYSVKDTAQKIIDGEFNLSFSGVCDYIIGLFLGGIKENSGYITKMTVVALISGVAASLWGGKNEIGVFCLLCIVSLLSLKAFSYAQSVADETCNALFIFTQSLMPSVVGASVAMGQVAQSAACAASFCAMQIFVHICSKIILPFICVLTVLCVVDSLNEVSYLKGVISFLKQTLKWGTGLMLTLYTAVIALQTQTAGAFDTVGGKTVKYAVGSFVPIVGSALSDSLEFIISSGKVIKNALGISGIIGVCSLCTGPLINLLALSLCYKLASAVASVAAEERVTKVINEIGGGLLRICINITAVSVMFVISLAFLCRMGGF